MIVACGVDGHRLVHVRWRCNGTPHIQTARERFTSAGGEGGGGDARSRLLPSHPMWHILKAAALVIWDEAFSMHKQIFGEVSALLGNNVRGTEAGRTP